MRILLVANTLPPRDISGAGEQVLQLAAGLRQAGHEVEVLGRGTVLSADPEPRRLGTAGPKVLFPLTVVPHAWRTLRRLRPHVVQVHESDAAFVALLVKLLRAFLRPRPRLWSLLQVSYVEEIRAVRPLCFDGRILGRPGGVEKRFRWTKGPLQVVLGLATAWLSDVILAPSSRTASEIERDYRVRDVRVLPNVTGGLAVPAPSDGGDDFEPGFLLFVGRLRIRKGVEVLLEAFAGVLRERPGARLLIAGTGEQEASLRARAGELGPAVRFLGRCDGARVRRLLGGARCLVVPSIYEGMPLVILEAMSEAVPVVASAVSGIPEVVVDGETGWLVPPEDPGRLAAALLAALDDPAAAAARGDAGRRRRAALYTPRAAAERWLAWA